LHEIGRGGMGAVLVGRDPALDRPLAVKVLLAERCGDAGLEQRFLEEARICGRLQHPGVVPVYDVGRLDDGRPFFAMKLVKGRTLAQLLAERAGPADDLPRFLAVFEQVCQAVGYAHSRGVIHRDLKPTNVMVGEFGEVQVMDWGLAKVVAGGPPAPPAAAPPSPAASTIFAPRASDPDCRTQAGSVLGTPAYMAPEQARGENDALDARSDVFGLGAVLCEILTGKPPFEGATPEETRRRAARGDLDDALARLEACGADAELATLARACVDPRPARRPADAGAVAEAVTAHRRSAEERLRAAELARVEEQGRALRARQRLRWVLALTATVLASLALLAAGGWLWQRGQAETERREAAAKAAADREAAEATLKATADLEEGTGRALKGDYVGAKEVLRRAEVRLPPDGADELRGRVRALLGEVDLAERLDTIRLEATASRDDAFDWRAADAAYAKAFADHGVDLAGGDAEAAVERVRAATLRERLTAALVDWHLVALRTKGPWLRLLTAARSASPEGGARRRLCDALLDKDAGRLRDLAADPGVAGWPASDACVLIDALQYHDEIAAALNVARASRRSHPDDVWVNLLLGRCLELQSPNRWEEAALYFQSAAALRPRCLGAYINLGGALVELRRYEEAERVFRDALSVQSDSAMAHNGLGAALLEQGKEAEAEREVREALRLRPDDAEAHNNLAAVLVARGRPAEAEDEARQALLRRPDYFEAHYGLGRLLAQRGEAEEAEREFRAALRARADDPAAHALRGLALEKLKRPDEAEKEYRAALRRQPGLVMARNNLGALLAESGRNAEAEEQFRVLTFQTPEEPDAHAHVADLIDRRGGRARAEDAAREFGAAARLRPGDARLRVQWGDALRDLEDRKGSEKQYREAIRIDPDFPEAHFHLAEALRRGGEVGEAEGEFRAASRLRDDYPEAHCNLGILLRDQGRYAEGLVELRRGHELGSRRPGWDYPSGRWVEECRRLAELNAVLPAALDGSAAPADGDAALGLSDLCCRRGRHADAVRLYAAAFAADPTLAGEPRIYARYNAACCAALAAAGAGADADRARLRALALSWLREQFAEESRRAAVRSYPAWARDEAARRLRHWQEDADLAGVRDGDALEKLPAAERAVWRKLWADVDALLREAGPDK
jgi:serine/threonine-protein kinase